MALSQVVTANLLGISRIALAHSERGGRSLPGTATDNLLFIEKESLVDQDFIPRSIKYFSGYV